MKYLLLAYTKEGYLSTHVPENLFQGTFEVLKKVYRVPLKINQQLDERFIENFIRSKLKDGTLPFSGGVIEVYYPEVLALKLLIEWKLCYIEVDEILSNIKADIWDEGFDVEFGPMLILKGIENGH